MPVWVIRGGDEGRAVDAFVDGGFVAYAFDDVGDGRLVERHQAIRLVEAGGRYADPADAVNRFHQFVTVMAEGDPLLVPDPARKALVVGVVDGAYSFDADAPAGTRYRHRRPVRWVGRHGRDEMPAAWADTISKQRHPIQRYDAAALDQHVAAVVAGEVGRPAGERRRPTSAGAGRSTSSGSTRSSSPRASTRSSRAPATPKPPPRLLRTCPGCGFNLNVVLFDGEDLCRDCR